MRDEGLDLLSAILDRAVDSVNDIAYISIGGNLVILPADRTKPILFYKLERL